MRQMYPPGPVDREKHLFIQGNRCLNRAGAGATRVAPLRGLRKDGLRMGNRMEVG